MKASFFFVSAALQSVAVTALPVTLDERSPARGGNGESVQTAASSFAGDVAIVSSSLNGMGATTDQNQIRTMARKAFVAEKDEDQHRAVLNDAAGRDARQANRKIVDNTPIVLDGLQSMMRNPSMANVMKQLSKVESARNANILPSITQLSSSAFDNTGVNTQAKQFQPTTGTQNLKQLMAGGTGATTNANAGTDTTATNKGGATGTGNTAAKGSGAATTGKGKGTAGAGTAAGTATQKAGADSTGNTAAKGSSPAATTGKGKGAAAGAGAGAGTATQKGGATGTGNTAAKGSSPASATTGKGKGTAASKGGAAGAGAGAATTGNDSTKGAGAGTKGAGNAAAAGDDAAAASTTKGAAGKGNANGAGNNAAADDDEEEDN